LIDITQQFVIATCMWWWCSKNSRFGVIYWTKETSSSRSKM